MHLWQVKGDVGLVVIPESLDLCLNTGIVKERKFVFTYRYPLVDTWLIVEAVVIAKTTLINDLVDEAAAFATKDFFLQFYIGSYTVFTAMKALHRLIGDRFSRHKYTAAKLSRAKKAHHE